MEIDESTKYGDVEIIIKCPHIDSRLEKIIQSIKQISTQLIGEREGRKYNLRVEGLYYMESVDNQTFLYDHQDVFDSNLKLYELEEMLKDTSFMRISKNLIVNTAHIESVKALFNGRFEAMLTNNEKVIVNRHYVKAFKEKILM